MRRRSAAPQHPWQEAEGVGWQHGEVPEPPDGLLEASGVAWSTWMEAWFAAFWSPSDLPGLRQLIRLYDQVERGEFQRSAECRIQMDTYGITPKGQQDRRWKPPPEPVEPTASSSLDDTGTSSTNAAEFVPAPDSRS